MSGRQYSYRTVSVGYRKHIEVAGIQPANEEELADLLRILHEKHNWPLGLIVFVGQYGEGVATPQSSGLSAYTYYVREVRVGPHRSDVHVTPWQRDSI